MWFAAEYDVDPDLSNMACVSKMEDCATAELQDKLKKAAPGSKVTLWSPSSTASLGYMIQLANQGVRQSTIKGKVTTDGAVSGTIEEQINPLVSLVMSAALDHAKEEYRFGFGIQVGGAMRASKEPTAGWKGHSSRETLGRID